MGRRESDFPFSLGTPLTQEKLVYTNSLLATLNARKRIRGLSDGIDTLSTGVGSLRFATRSTVLGARSSGPTGPQPNASYASSKYRFIVSFSFIFQADILTKAGIVKRAMASVSMTEEKVYPDTVRSTSFRISLRSKGLFTDLRRIRIRR